MAGVVAGGAGGAGGAGAHLPPAYKAPDVPSDVQEVSKDKVPWVGVGEAVSVEDIPLGTLCVVEPKYTATYITPAGETLLVTRGRNVLATIGESKGP